MTDSPQPNNTSPQHGCAPEVPLPFRTAKLLKRRSGAADFRMRRYRSILGCVW